MSDERLHRLATGSRKSRSGGDDEIAAGRRVHFADNRDDANQSQHIEVPPPPPPPHPVIAQHRRLPSQQLSSSPLYKPIVYASLGFMMASVACNWYYIRNPPECAMMVVADPEAKQKCDRDRWERTVTAGAFGAIIGVVAYYTLVGSSSSTIQMAHEDE